MWFLDLENDTLNLRIFFYRAGKTHHLGRDYFESGEMSFPSTSNLSVTQLQ